MESRASADNAEGYAKAWRCEAYLSRGSALGDNCVVGPVVAEMDQITMKAGNKMPSGMDIADVQ